ncbi:MAG: DUF3786 domain-containing protein [Dehalococcoidales bacterium]|nr:DUF3786 domain-containing protein [Dehalococcoidales bacterium]
MVYQTPKDKPVYNLDNALGIAREKMRHADIQKQCANSGAQLQPDGTVRIKYLNRDYRLDPKSGEVNLLLDQSPVGMRDKILILHYFIRASGAPLTGKQITFRDLPGGLVYYPTFLKRTIQPLLDKFGKDAPSLHKAGQALGARQGEIGDASLIIDAFPRVPINFILWQGDEELTPDLNLLLDANILEYLESEDVTIVCETIAWQLVNAIKKA